MQFSDYQTQSRVTAAYPDLNNNFIYPTLGLVGEAGELAEKVKKLMRDKAMFTPADVTDEVKAEVLKELGDVLWYTAQLATEFGVNLDQVAEQNMEKLKSRMERGKITGDGDNR
jgi:NTP pyrophosphatase (non-canonical NTP hydrolase)